MIKDAIFISNTNKEQIKWWNNIASKLVRFELIDKVIDGESGKVIGYVLGIGGLLAKFVAKKNVKFIENPETVIFRKN